MTTLDSFPSRGMCVEDSIEYWTFLYYFILSYLAFLFYFSLFWFWFLVFDYFDYLVVWSFGLFRGKGRFMYFL